MSTGLAKDLVSLHTMDAPSPPTPSSPLSDEEPFMLNPLNTLNQPTTEIAEES